ncbi:hypothetical protein HNP99_000787 [Flavobacterium sp. 28A]|uniref:hypothetical protein n=1 Tax=Flavobacterium sp. 28A TaxID=2735895 RepID=UPI00156FAFD8|nr:hypothetical protein [Flavobacterium sp. 28A]NRT14447.1 hypothetical protein [Flavobacterium sp. 28A]
MSTNVPQNQENQEIDLFQVFTKIGSFFQWLNTLVFKSIQFLLKNVVLLIVLVILGFGVGLYLDTNYKSYKQQLIVEPNFESTDYLYSKIGLIESKIEENDVAFLKGIGIKNPSVIMGIKIEPIVDIYKFINSNTQNIELLQLMAQNGDLKTVVEETATSKNYAYHTLIIDTNTKVDQQDIQPILNYLNTSNYYSSYQKIYKRNTAQKIKVKEEVIVQIDAAINQFTAVDNKTSKNDKLVYYNENIQLNNMIRTKDSLVNVLGYLNLALLDYDKIINDKSLILNKINNKSTKGKLKLLLPIFFVFLFIFMRFFISFYRKESLKAKEVSVI